MHAEDGCARPEQKLDRDRSGDPVRPTENDDGRVVWNDGTTRANSSELRCEKITRGRRTVRGKARNDAATIGATEREFLEDFEVHGHALTMAKSDVVKSVLLTGGTGFIGRKLTKTLLDRGDSVTVLSRDPSRTSGRLPKGSIAVAYDPEREGPWLDELGRASAVVHLAGENVGQRWTEDAKRRILSSRVDSTRLVVEGMRRAEKKPDVFVCASAIGIYGPRPSTERLTETSARGEGFLADVVDAWEAAARPAETLGVRTVMLRIGIVLGEGGGPLEKMLLPFKMFAGGPIGSGSHVISWVHADDVVGLILFCLDKPEARGPINAVSPNAVTNEELSKAIGRAMHRPSWFRVPEAFIKVGMGEAAEIVTTGQHVLPRRAEELGYSFRWPNLDPALASILK